MTLEIEFNFVSADPCDPKSQNDCEILDIKLDGETVPLRAENDPALNLFLMNALHRLHEIIPK